MTIKTIDGFTSVVNPIDLLNTLSETLILSQEEIISDRDFESKIDEIDQVEIIMKLEKIYNINIDDDLCYSIWSGGFISRFLISGLRDSKLSELGIQ